MQEFIVKHSVKFIMGIVVSILGAAFTIGGLYSNFMRIEKTVENHDISINEIKENNTEIRTDVKWIRETLSDIKNDIK